MFYCFSYSILLIRQLLLKVDLGEKDVNLNSTLRFAVFNVWLVTIGNSVKHFSILKRLFVHKIAL